MNMDFYSLMKIRHRRRHHYSSGNSGSIENFDFWAMILFMLGIAVLLCSIKNDSSLFRFPLISSLDRILGRTVMRIIMIIIGILLIAAGVVKVIKNS